MKNTQTISNLLQFYIEAEKLKATLRHSWTSDTTRQESTAEHSWMLSLIAITLFEHLKIKIDQLKVLKLVIIHDLAEAVTGDIPAFEVSERMKAKKQNEKLALKKLARNLPSKTKKELFALNAEYEAKETLEAKMAQALDKLEAPLQHAIAGIETWDQNDFNYSGTYRKYDFVKIDEAIIALTEEISTFSRKKITEANQLHRLKEEVRILYEELNAKEKNLNFKL